MLVVSWVLPLSVRDLLLGWRCTFCAMDKQRVWNAGSLCIFWTLWNTRNNIVFKDEFFVYTKVQVSFCTSLLGGDQVFFANDSLSLVLFFD